MANLTTKYTVVLALLALSSANAYSHYRSSIPNGEKSPGGPVYALPTLL